MSWAVFPATAAWTHSGAQTGFEVAWFAAADGGAVLTGCTAATDGNGRRAVDGGWVRIPPSAPSSGFALPGRRQTLNCETSRDSSAVTSATPSAADRACRASCSVSVLTVETVTTASAIDPVP